MYTKGFVVSTAFLILWPSNPKRLRASGCVGIMTSALSSGVVELPAGREEAATSNDGGDAANVARALRAPDGVRDNASPAKRALG